MNWLVALVLAGSVAPAGLKGVINAEKSKQLPAAARDALVRDGFTVVAGAERDFFSLYDKNAYEKVPSFISTDVVLHVFHVRFDDEVASLEQKVAVPALKAFASKQLARALAAWPATGSPTPELRALAQYHATALALVEPSATIDARVVVREDVKRLEHLSGGAVAACPGALEPTLFKPRGHYDRPALRGYFRAVTFYAQCSFSLDGEGLARALDVARLVDAEAAKELGTVRALQTFVSGPADDPGLDALAPFLRSLPAWPTPMPSSAVSGIAVKSSASVPTLDPRGPRFRLLGGSTTADAALMARTAGTLERPAPSVLDVFTALGSLEARKELAPSPALQQVLAEPLPPGGGMAARWLEVLRALLSRQEGQPPFAATDAWARRTLVSAAGSYAELRHDTLLYVKQPMVMAQGGDSAELPASKVGGYVEPRPDVYRALLGLTSELAALSPEGAKRGADLDAFLRFLIEVSETELANKPFPKDLDERLRTVGSELEHLSRVHGDESPPQALVADIFTVALPDGASRVLHVGTGDVDEVWVVAPRAGKLVLMRGGAFSFYEFLGAPGERLNDSHWLERLYEKAPPRPSWAQPITAPTKKRDAMIEPR